MTEQHITEVEYRESLEEMLRASNRRRVALEAKAFEIELDIKGWRAAIVSQRYRIQQLKD